MALDSLRIGLKNLHGARKQVHSFNLPLGEPNRGIDGQIAQPQPCRSECGGSNRRGVFRNKRQADKAYHGHKAAPGMHLQIVHACEFNPLRGSIDV